MSMKGVPGNGIGLGMLHAERTRRGMTQQQVADRLGVGRATVSAWECLGCTPLPDRLDRLCLWWGWDYDQTLKQLLAEEGRHRKRYKRVK